MKRVFALLLALLLLTSLWGCGNKELSAFRTLEVLGTKRYCTICRGGDKLSPRIEAAMAELARTGELQSASIRWLGSDRSVWDSDSAGMQDLLGDEEQPEARTLLFGVEADFYPMAYTENDVLQGFCVDLAMGIGAVLGWDVQIIAISPSEVGTQLSSGNIDCALGFDGSLVKADSYDIGSCFLESDIVLAVRSESGIKRVKDLQDQRVGTVSDPAVLAALRGNENLTKRASGATEYLSLSRCIEALDKGWCAAVALDELALSFYQAAPGASLAAP